MAGSAERPCGELFPQLPVDEVLPQVQKEFRIKSGAEHT
jgi:hypothetical protein